ncbi:MAG: Gfo/Idh/MocA family oxidoreductase [Verrucomicrobiales bacterium]
MKPERPSSRRSFLKTAAGATLAAPWIGWKSTANGQAPSKEVRYAAFGSNGRAWGNITSMAGVSGVTLVAVAEIDTSRAGNVTKGFPDAKVYQDWRQLLDKEAGNIDAVLVATPDHMHAPIALSGMQLGKHAYCEKPLTRTLHEARVLAAYAAENRLATQMGIQVGSSNGNRTSVQALRDKLVGKVLSVHSMVGKSWGSDKPLPEREDVVPATLNWDQWLGVGKKRSFISGEFHPSNWRKRIGYGTGTLGDMGCHIYHPWFMGLGAPTPLRVTSQGVGPVDGDSWPLNSRVHYLMAGNEFTGRHFRSSPGMTAAPALATMWRQRSVVTPRMTKATRNPMCPAAAAWSSARARALVIPHGGMPTLYVDGKAVKDAIPAVRRNQPSRRLGGGDPGRRRSGPGQFQLFRTDDRDGAVGQCRPAPAGSDPRLGCRRLQIQTGRSRCHGE